jgi:hypothetical protein
MTFGKLRFVSSVDIGDLGPNQGAEVIYKWRWYHNVPSLALWLVLAVALILIKANRTPRILLILVPLLIVNILRFLLTQISSSGDVEMSNMMFSSMVAGITFLWLFAPKLGRFNPWIAFFLAFALITMFFLLGIVSYLGFVFSRVAMESLAMLTVLALGMLLGFVLAGWRCRKRYGPVRFLLWLAAWMVVVSLASTIVFYVITFFIQKVPISITRILFMASIVGIILAIFLYVINLPYMILTLRSPFFRERFYACLRLKAMPAAPQQTDIGWLNEQNPGTEIPEKGDST